MVNIARTNGDLMKRCLSALFILSAFIPLLHIDCNPHPSRFEGYFEDYGGRRLDLIAKYLPDNPVVFEAGGHYGEDTVRLSRKWPNGRVVSFEPNPYAFKKLSEATSGLTNVDGYQLAANDYNGMATFYVCFGTNGDNPVFDGASSLLEPSEWMKVHYQGPVIEAPCVILDDWCHDNDVDHIDFMWLDMEGIELQVLQSSPETLKNVRVIYTGTNFMEFRKGMTQFDALKEHLESAGFRLLSHWYAEGFQSDAIFVKKELFDLGFNH